MSFSYNNYFEKVKYKNNLIGIYIIANTKQIHKLLFYPSMLIINTVFKICNKISSAHPSYIMYTYNFKASSS